MNSILSFLLLVILIAVLIIEDLNVVGMAKVEVD